MISYDVDYWVERARTSPITFDEAMYLSGMDVFDLMKIANRLTEIDVGETVTYAVSYNINYTNYCTASCPICAFYVPYKNKRFGKGYELTKEMITREAYEAKKRQVTEVHIVGGFNPDLSIEYYEDMFRTIRSIMPEVTIKAFTIPEIDFIARTTGNSIKETVSRFMEAGMNAHTGGGAEIFDPEVRKIVATPEKISGEKWLEDAKIIHALGLKGNSTMTYGHVEGWNHIVDHMIRIRDNQMEVPGFLSFIPLKFSPENTALLKSGRVKGPAPVDKDLKVIALARIIMGEAIRNISVYWVALGKLVAQIAINGGGSDLVGTAYSEKVFGATDRRNPTTTEELNHLVRQAGKIPAIRDTFYNIMAYA
ncbi:MAG: radical SAM protein [Thermoplasma acidophilum]|nr:radical SAM protein [Thermoplasma acidophilum]